MSIQIDYTTGYTDQVDTLQEAIDQVKEKYADAVFYSYDGWGILYEDEAALDSLRTPDVGRILVWRNEEDADNDDGARAIASLFWVDDN